MPEQLLTDEQILDITDDAPPSPETSEATTATESSEPSAVETTQEQLETTPGKEQVANKEEQEPATYEQFGSPEDFKELAEQDRLIFSDDPADRATWVEGFGQAHPDTLWQLFGHAAKWFSANRPAQFANFQKAVGSAPELQAPQAPAIEPEMRDFADSKLKEFFDERIAASLPQLQSMAGQARERLVRRVHDEIRAAINKDVAARANSYAVTPQSLHDVVMLMAKTGLAALPKILGGQKMRISEAPLGLEESRGMDYMGILNSTRRGDASRTLNRAPKLTRAEARNMTGWDLVHDDRAVAP